MEAFQTMIEAAISGATSPVMKGVFLAASVFVPPFVVALGAHLMAAPIVEKL